MDVEWLKWLILVSLRAHTRNLNYFRQEKSDNVKLYPSNGLLLSVSKMLYSLTNQMWWVLAIYVANWDYFIHVQVYKHVTHTNMPYTDEPIFNNFIIVGIWSNMLGGVQWWEDALWRISLLHEPIKTAEGWWENESAIMLLALRKCM